MYGYNKYMREQAQFEYEQELRKIQLERMRQGQPADPAIDRQLRESASSRASRECRTEVYRINETMMKCKVCPGQQITMTNCDTY